MRLAVVGSAIVDLIARPTSSVRADSSNEATIVWTAGGAGRNVAENLARLGAHVSFVTDLADDAPGQYLLEGLRAAGVDTRIAARERTGIYLAILDRDGGLDRGYCQTGTERVGLAAFEAVLTDLETFDGVVIDANLSAEVVAGLARRCRAGRVPYALETVAHERSLRVIEAIPGCAFLKPDRGEATTLTGLPCDSLDEGLACADALRARGAERVVVSLGASGLAFAGDGTRTVLPPMPASVVDVTGAGDALLAAAFLGMLMGVPPARYLDAGRRAAALACASVGAVNPALSPDVFDE